jgi:hypothetical protein
MRIWRKLKTLGCGALRDGVYLLPDLGTLRSELDGLSDETVREGGKAWRLLVHAESEQQGRAYRALFSRADEYASFLASLAPVRQSMATISPNELNRMLRKLRRDFDALRATDYFPDAASGHAEEQWQQFVSAVQSWLSPGEPQPSHGAITRLDRTQYQRRTWATRRKLWVDRVASAWLIQRFIDAQARFLWLDKPADCPADALGFDFDQASFTHVGERVTFEVLLASFGLDRDPGLQKLGAMVHALDAGGSFVAEAAGFEAMLGGLRERTPDDDHLLSAVGPVLDALYVHFSSGAPAPDSENQEET